MIQCLRSRETPCGVCLHKTAYEVPCCQGDAVPYWPVQAIHTTLNTSCKFLHLIVQSFVQQEMVETECNAQWHMRKSTRWHDKGLRIIREQSIAGARALTLRPSKGMKPERIMWIFVCACVRVCTHA